MFVHLLGAKWGGEQFELHCDEFIFSTKKPLIFIRDEQDVGYKPAPTGRLMCMPKFSIDRILQKHLQ